MYCEKCGTSILEGERFCSKCGAPVKYGEREESETDSILKLKQGLAVFLGVYFIVLLLAVLVLSNRA